jgi:hypothetical protein
MRAGAGRSLNLTFGALAVEPSDNYVDLLPGQPVGVTLKTTAPIEQLHNQLKRSR